MLESIKRWLSGLQPRSHFADVQEWAEKCDWEFKLPRDGEGFIIEAVRATMPWRLEWGPSQRVYFPGSELRVRGETGGANDMHMLLITRPLMELLERQVFEQYTEQLQTRIDNATPEEMRWLVLYPKPSAADLKGLREQFGGVSSVPQMLPQWLDGPLTDKLVQARKSWLGEKDPLVLIAQRGRLTLRTPMPQPEPDRMMQALNLFGVALREARRVAAHWSMSSRHDEQSTQPSMWGREGPPTKM